MGKGSARASCALFEDTLVRAAKKWTPVFREKARETKESRACCDSINSQHALGFGAAKMIRRILGLAHVEDLESIAGPKGRARCERRALTFASELMFGAKGFSGMDEVVAAARTVEIE